MFEEPQRTPAAGGRFPATRWSLVLAASRGDGESSQALESFCGLYWKPVFDFVRAQGWSEADAEDLTQEFFADRLLGDFLRRADPAKGRLRTYLASALRNFIASARERAAAAKRGGRWERLPCHVADCEEALPPSDQAAPDRSFDRQWALHLLERVRETLGTEYQRSRRGDLFEALHPWIASEGDPPPAVELAHRLGLTEGAVRVAVHRLRQRYRDLLVAEVARTVGDEIPVQDELRALLEVV